jgi:hypothetical protein
VIEIGDGRARVLASPCTNQTCVASGTIHSRGQWIACLPNGIFVSVESAGSGPGAQDAAGERGSTELDGAVW